jgi:nucleotide-binding universal stress UspA family protein
MPGVPVLPVLGIVANLALIANLPTRGVGVGVGVVVVLLFAYLVWGGGPEIEDLYERVVEPEPGEPSTPPTGVQAAETTEPPEDAFRVLVPVARPSRAEQYVRLASTFGAARSETPLVQVVNVTNIPDQTPNELVQDTATERAGRISDTLADADLDVDYTVEAHISRDVAFDIVHTAREDEADLILMGYPEEHPEIAEGVEYNSPCDVLYTRGFGDDPVRSLDTINVGVGGGPHHQALLPFVNALGREGRSVNLISVAPTGEEATETEDPSETLAALVDTETVQVHSVSANSVAEGLVSRAAENGGVLMIGASRDRRLRRWVFGSTPDRVIDLADPAEGGVGVPVVVYASATSVPQRVEDSLFPVYKFLRRLGPTAGSRRTGRSADGSAPDANARQRPDD